MSVALACVTSVLDIKSQAASRACWAASTSVRKSSSSLGKGNKVPYADGKGTCRHARHPKMGVFGEYFAGLYCPKWNLHANITMALAKARATRTHLVPEALRNGEFHLFVSKRLRRM